MQMRIVKLIAPVVFAIIGTGFSADIGSAQTPELECKQLSNVPDNGAPLAVELKALASGKIASSKIEAACRSALRADPGNPTLMFQLGRALSLGNKRLEAITYYLDAADRGHAGAMTDLGGVFEYGIGVPKNMATALVWYQRAAELGHAGAMDHLGQLSENGVEVPQDFAIAIRWYEKAAGLGNSASMNNLANLFRHGRGVVPDLPAAASWYLKAAQAGSHELSSNKVHNLAHHLTAGALCIAAKYSCLRRFRVNNGGYQRASVRSASPQSSDIGGAHRHFAFVPTH